MKHLRSQQAGQSTVENVVALGLIIFLAVGISGIFSITANSEKHQTLVQTKDRIAGNLTRMMSIPASIRAATYAAKDQEKNNTYLSTCVMGGSTPEPCQNMNNDGTYRPFRLYLPMVENKTGAYAYFKTSGAITGTKDKPMRYNAAGAICDTSLKACSPADYPLEVYTEFLPVCPPLFEAALRGWAGATLPNPVYPDGLAPISVCWYARYLKVRLTMQPSGYGTPAATSTSFLSSNAFEPISSTMVIDAALVRYARQ
jgi:hypothetical protein